MRYKFLDLVIRTLCILCFLMIKKKPRINTSSFMIIVNKARFKVVSQCCSQKKDKKLKKSFSLFKISEK